MLRILLPLALSSAVLAASAPLGLLSREEAAAIKAAIKRRDPRLTGAAEAIRREAEASMTQGPWSVTFHRPKHLKVDPHDFFSEGPYWWPDPNNPAGPYIRRDGVVNPERFIDNDRDLGLMSETVFTLGLAAWAFDDARFAARATEVLRVWFLDLKTRMTPHLEHGQAIRGINTGRGIGIIDTRPLIFAVQGIAFLEETGRWSAVEREGVRRWFTDYVRWLTSSPKGLEEKKNGNNHSTWWAAQVAAFATFTGDTAALNAVWAFHRDYLVPHQMRPDGSCPLEEARTKSLGYSSMNLDGFAVLCRLAEKREVDLWRFRLPNGAGVATAVEYLAPFVEDPSKWLKPQIEPYRPGRAYFLALAGMALEERRYTELYRKLAKPNTPWLWLVELMLEQARPRSNKRS